MFSKLNACDITNNRLYINYSVDVFTYDVVLT